MRRKIQKILQMNPLTKTMRKKGVSHVALLECGHAEACYPSDVKQRVTGINCELCSAEERKRKLERAAAKARHWTQTPEGRARMKAQAEARWQKESKPISMHDEQMLSTMQRLLGELNRVGDKLGRLDERVTQLEDVRTAPALTPEERKEYSPLPGGEYFTPDALEKAERE